MCEPRNPVRYITSSVPSLRALTVLPALASNVIQGSHDAAWVSGGGLDRDGGLGELRRTVFVPTTEAVVVMQIPAGLARTVLDLRQWDDFLISERNAV